MLMLQVKEPTQWNGHQNDHQRSGNFFKDWMLDKRKEEHDEQTDQSN